MWLACSHFFFLVVACPKKVVSRKFLAEKQKWDNEQCKEWDRFMRNIQNMRRGKNKLKASTLDRAAEVLGDPIKLLTLFRKAEEHSGQPPSTFGEDYSPREPIASAGLLLRK
jgi:hypothetical protein